MSKFAILFLLTYASGLIASLSLYGAWGFYIYEIVYFLNPDQRWWSANIPAISYSFFTVVFMCMALLLHGEDHRNNRLLDAPQVPWMLLLLAIYGITSFYAVDPLVHQQSLTQLVKMFIVMGLAYKLIDSPQKLQHAFWAYLAGATYIGMEARRVGRDWQGRVEGIGTVDAPDANGIAAAIAPATIFLILFFWRGNFWSRLAAIFMGAWIVNALILINSRGSFLAVVAGAGYFTMMMIFSKLQQGKQRIAAVLIVIVGLSGAIYQTDDVFWGRMETLSNIQDESKSGSHRYRMWLSTFDLVADYPQGVGANGYNVLSERYVDAALFAKRQTQKAVHSSWFQALAEVGWLGLLVYIGLVVSCFRLTAKLKRKFFLSKDVHNYFQTLAIEAALITFLVAGTFIDRFRAEIFYWLVMFIACAGNIYLFKKHQTHSKAEDAT